MLRLVKHKLHAHTAVLQKVISLGMVQKAEHFILSHAFLQLKTCLTHSVGPTNKPQPVNLHHLFGRKRLRAHIVPSFVKETGPHSRFEGTGN